MGENLSILKKYFNILLTQLANLFNNKYIIYNTFIVSTVAIKMKRPTDNNGNLKMQIDILGNRVNLKQKYFNKYKNKCSLKHYKSIHTFVLADRCASI
jgi:uncharacterized protein YgiM (DUF1202 family)